MTTSSLFFLFILVLRGRRIVCGCKARRPEAKCGTPGNITDMSRTLACGDGSLGGTYRIQNFSNVLRKKLILGYLAFTSKSIRFVFSKSGWSPDPRHKNHSRPIFSTAICFGNHPFSIFVYSKDSPPTTLYSWLLPYQGSRLPITSPNR